MQALGVVAPNPTPVIDAMVPELADRGRVGVVTESATDPAPEWTGVSTAYDLGDTGWQASGGERTLQSILDQLARRHEYAVVAGFPAARLPQLVVGDESVRRELLRVEDPTDADPETVIDALADVQPYETLGSLVAKAKSAAGEEFAGAIATFTGRVRAREDADDDRTDRLEFDQYGAVATQRLATIREELTARDGVYEVLVHHRTGVVEAGEDIVFVVVLAGHREEAFATVEDGIDRLKAEVPIFKKEVTVSEEFWRHTRG